MENRHIITNNAELLTHGASSVVDNARKDLLTSMYGSVSAAAFDVMPSTMTVKAGESSKMKSVAPENVIPNMSGGTLSMAALPLGALGSNKLGLQVGEIENIPIFNTLDGTALELQAFPGSSQPVQGIQTVKLTLINYGDQQTILLTTPSAALSGLDQSTEGVTITIPEHLLGTDINLTGLPTASVTIDNTELESPCPPAKLLNYTTMTSLPPITSVSDKLYSQQLQGSADIRQPSPSFAIHETKPIMRRNGEKSKVLEKPENANFRTSVPSFLSTSVPVTVSIPNEEVGPTMVDFSDADLKTLHSGPSPNSTRCDLRLDQDHPDSISPMLDNTELDTKALAQRITSELKRHTIPQALFAQRILHRSQGTLSDLLRNPKPWSKLKSGRETFRRMWKWLNEPENQRMSPLHLSTAGPVPTPKRKPEDISKVGDDKLSKKPRLVFTDIQRRTLHAIFKETNRPSKEMQATIAQQLNLEVSTVANFFMNARRRSSDKWREDNDTKLPSSSSHSSDASSPNHSSQNMHAVPCLSEPPPLKPVSELSLPPHLSSEALQPSTLCSMSSALGTSLDLPVSPAPPRLSCDATLAVQAQPNVYMSVASALPSQLITDRSADISNAGGILVACAGQSIATIPSQLMTHSLQLLPGGQNAIFINAQLESDGDSIGTITIPNSSSCLLSSAGLLPSVISISDSISVPTTFLTTVSSPQSHLMSTPLISAVQSNHKNNDLLQSQSGTMGLVLPSAATLIAHDRVPNPLVGSPSPTHPNVGIRHFKPENTGCISSSTLGQS